ncbi:hypothetical protein [Streptomyces sp. NPDC060194]|uniref:hypothetical protein n=1 Tax=Streptomyces sp. NPDC060194 TaxID=3347069 RepID=UPI00365FB153
MALHLALRDGWWERNIVEPGKLPLLVALAAFIATFLLTRVVTRLIRSGRGPFRDVTPGGLHVHHVVPGIVLMVCGGFGAVASGTSGLAATVPAFLFGVGAGLALDEFALVLYLQDVYWGERGRKSIEAVILTAALVALLLCGFLPFGVEETPGEEEHPGRLALTATIAWHFLLALVSVAKGKGRLAVIGILVPFVAFFSAVRLARPGSWWAERWYRRRPRAARRAAARAARHDARWAGPRRRLQDWLGGFTEH